MVGWIDGWMDGWVGACYGGWMDRWVDQWINVWMDGSYFKGTLTVLITNIELNDSGPHDEALCHFTDDHSFEEGDPVLKRGASSGDWRAKK